MTRRGIVLGKTFAISTALMLATTAWAQSATQGETGQPAAPDAHDARQHRRNLHQDNQVTDPQNQDKTTLEGGKGQTDSQARQNNPASIDHNNPNNQYDQNNKYQDQNPQ